MLLVEKGQFAFQYFMLLENKCVCMYVCHKILLDTSQVILLTNIWYMEDINEKKQSECFH